MVFCSAGALALFGPTLEELALSPLLKRTRPCPKIIPSCERMTTSRKGGSRVTRMTQADSKLSTTMAKTTAAQIRTYRRFKKMRSKGMGSSG